jgi:hypothetical protein
MYTVNTKIPRQIFLRELDPHILKIKWWLKTLLQSVNAKFKQNKQKHQNLKDILKTTQNVLIFIYLQVLQFKT